jgi:hypothetical protein
VSKSCQWQLSLRSLIVADELIWEAPSGRATASGATKVVADRLRARVDEWAIIEETPVPSDEAQAKKARAQASNRASLISQGRIAAFSPKGVFEAASRSKDQYDAEGNPVIRVYARFRGDEYAVIDAPEGTVPQEGTVPAEEPVSV